MYLPLTRCWAMHRFPSPTDTLLFAFVSLDSLPLQESFCRHESVVCSAAMDVYTTQERSKLTLHAYTHPMHWILCGLGTRLLSAWADKVPYFVVSNIGVVATGPAGPTRTALPIGPLTGNEPHPWQTDRHTVKSLSDDNINTYPTDIHTPC